MNIQSQKRLPKWVEMRATSSSTGYNNEFLPNIKVEQCQCIEKAAEHTHVNLDFYLVINIQYNSIDVDNESMSVDVYTTQV